MNTMDYKESYAKTAREILSKPFKSKQHVCEALGITVQVFDEWLAEIEEFELAVAQGFLAGEVKARNFLAKAALLNSAKIDTKMFAELAKDIYGIGVKSDMADNTEPVKWQVEFVESTVEDTKETSTVSNNE